MEQQKPYLNPYLAGVGIGIALLLMQLSFGAGLGASKFLSILSGVLAKSIGLGNEYLNKYKFADYYSFLILGVIIGAIISAKLSGRLAITVDKGESASNKLRYTLAFIGGFIGVFGARLAKGCTSGHGLSGGSTLAVGSWIFMLAAFAGGYIAILFVRRQWR